MTRSALSAAAVAIGIVGLLAFVAFKTQSLDFQEHSHYQAGLVRLKESDTRLNANVLESRFELTPSYDSLVVALRELEDTQAELELLPGFISAEARAELTALLASHRVAVHDKEALVERFKSENAILRNTLHYLPTLYAGLASSERAPDGVGDLVRDVLLYNLTGDLATAHSVTARLAVMATSPVEDSTPDAYALQMLVGHVGIVLTSKPTLDRLVGQIVAVPTLARVEALEASYAREYDRALASANLYRTILVAVAGILLFCTLLILARLRLATLERNAANVGLVARNLELRRSEARKAAILESALDGVVIVDAEGVVSEFNPAAEHTFGYRRGEAIGKSLAELVRGIGAGGSPVNQLFVAGGSSLLGQRMLGTGRRADGAEMPLELAVMQIDCDGPPIFTAYLRDISERRHAEQALQHQAHHDGLTTLPNRTLLHERLQHEALSAQHTGQPMALLVMDLDRFKDVNDTLGHHAGDEILRQVARRLQSALRAGDTVARLGGDEFAVMLPATDVDAALIVAGKLLEDLALPFLVEERTLEIGASIGIALFPEHGTDAATLLRRADIALYVAKREQTGLSVYATEQEAHSETRLGLVGELRKAIENDELVLHYQPQIDVQSGALVGFEALARWPHAERGLVPPDEFIPLAEQTRLIRPLSRWVVTTALRQCADWLGTYLALPVSVNLSAHDLLDPGLLEFVETSLKEFGVAPELLRLEITESSLMEDPRGARESLVRLRALGVHIAIDDFGTGYSSLEYLRNLPVDALKIDRSFVRDMATDDGARAIVRATIDLADDLGLHVVAEGVEDPATWEVLAALGCDMAQGYYFSAALPVSEVARWAANAGHLRVAQDPNLHTGIQLAERARNRGARLAAEEQFIARKRAEGALLESEERLRLAVDAAGMATWDWNLAEDSITWSGATAPIFGSEAHLLSQRLASFVEQVHPDDRARIQQALAAAVSESTDLSLEFHIVRDDGGQRGLACTGRVIRNPSGRSVRVVGTLLDITSRQEGERQREALAHADKLRALGQLASGVAHELNQSLLLIAGYSDLVRQGLQQPVVDQDELVDTLAVVTRAALDGGAVVKRLLTFARAKPDGDSEQVDLGVLLGDVAQWTAPRWRDATQAEGRPIQLDCVIQGDVAIMGWPASLSEALTNLIFNAVDAMPDGGTIQLAAHRVDDRVQLIVTDSGIGMQPDLQARLFEPFFSTKGDEGAGLGLAQVFGIVEQHSGQIAVRSALGSGTTFEISLPAAPPSLPTASASAENKPRRAGLRILAVDDEAAIGSMVARILRPMRHVVTTATSAEEALERLSAEPFDVIVSDLGLGTGMSGWDLAAQVRDRWPEIRFILATGWGAAIDPKEATLKGVSAVLAKPYHPDELERAIAA